jgi:hypothetical protein
MSEVRETYVISDARSTLSGKRTRVQYRLFELNIKDICIKILRKECHNIYINAEHKTYYKETGEYTPI